MSWSGCSRALNDRRKPLRDAQILLLGIAYKPDVADPRESPAFEILDLLIARGARVEYHDPWIPEAPPMRNWPDLPALASQPLTEATLAAQDAVLLVTHHSDVDYGLVHRAAPLIVDTRGVFRDRAPHVVKA